MVCNYFHHDSPVIQKCVGAKTNEGGNGCSLGTKGFEPEQLLTARAQGTERWHGHCSLNRAIELYSGTFEGTTCRNKNAHACTSRLSSDKHGLFWTQKYKTKKILIIFFPTCWDIYLLQFYWCATEEETRGSRKK